MKKRFVACLAVIVLMATLISGCQILSTSQSLETAGSPSLQAGCYKVEFLGMTAGSEVTSTWHYRVQGHSCTQPLRSWMLGLPSCAGVVDASPTPWGIVSSDLHYKMSGIQWQPGEDMQDTEFSVVLTGNVKEGVTRAGVNGQDLTIGNLDGPVCSTTAPQAGLVLKRNSNVSMTVQSGDIGKTATLFTGARRPRSSARMSISAIPESRSNTSHRQGATDVNNARERGRIPGGSFDRVKR